MPDCVRIAVNGVFSLITVLFAVSFDRADHKAIPCRGEQARTGCFASHRMPMAVGACRSVQAVFQKMLEKPSLTGSFGAFFTRAGEMSDKTLPPELSLAGAASSRSFAMAKSAGASEFTLGGQS